MNRASSATGWVRNPVMKSPELDPTQASSYELGWTYNPITGCLNHTPEGLCLGGMFPCYAFKLANGRLRQRYLANHNIAIQNETTGNPFRAPFYPRFWEERECEPITFEKSRRSKGIFICDMGELFGGWIPREWQQHIFTTIRCCPHHRFDLLTKQPSQLVKFSPFPDNCRVGVSVTTPDLAREAIVAFAQIEAKVKFASYEPCFDDVPCDHILDVIDWLIIGSQTKPYRPPAISHVQEIVEAADRAGVKVFLKDNLKPLLRNKEGWTPAKYVYARDCSGKEWLRQEVPNDP